MKHWIRVCVCVCSYAGTVHDCINFAWVGVFNAMPLWNGFEQTFGYCIGIFLYSIGPLALAILKLYVTSHHVIRKQILHVGRVLLQQCLYTYWHIIVQYMRFPFIQKMKISILYYDILWVYTNVISIIAFLLQTFTVPSSKTKKERHPLSTGKPGPFEGMESAGTASPQLRLLMASWGHHVCFNIYICIHNIVIYDI